jgi:hypothetical protein
MSMSKKDYELLARLIREERLEGEPDMEREEAARQEALDGLAIRMVKAFRQENPSFRPDLFWISSTPDRKEIAALKKAVRGR